MTIHFGAQKPFCLQENRVSYGGDYPNRVNVRDIIMCHITSQCTALIVYDARTTPRYAKRDAVNVLAIFGIRCSVSIE